MQEKRGGKKKRLQCGEVCGIWVNAFLVLLLFLVHVSLISGGMNGYHFATCRV